MRGNVTEVFKIFDSRDKQLLIPVYQRNYDWQRKQCSQLLTDLVDLAKTGRPKHFFGAVVGKPEDSWNWVVIDGQQRLTTVSLLMLAISRLSDARALSSPESDDADLGERIRRSYLLTDPDSHEPRFRLKPVKDDADAYRRLFGAESEFIESSNVTANYRYFMEEVPRQELTASQLWDAICKLEVMHLDLESHDDPQRIFESLNSTGLELSEADKVRNLVLMGLPAREQEKVYNDYWNRIEKNVSYNTDAFLRWYLVTKTSKTPRLDQVYETFKTFAADSRRQGAELLEEIRSYSDYYRQILTATTGLKAVDSRLRRLNLLKQDVVLPLLMPLLADQASERVTQEDLARCVEIIESYLFRRFACGYATNSLNKIFATIHKDVRKLRTSDHPFSDVLAYSLQKRTGSGIFPDDENFSEAFATRDFYNINSDRRRYIFECLENLNSNDTRDIANALEESKLSIEHVLPQTLTREWRDELGENAEETHRTWLNRIGNLTVTGYNSVYSNQSFQVKKTSEEGFLVSPYRLNAGIKTAPLWGEKEIRDRTKSLTASAVGYWAHPVTSFVPPVVELPTEPLGDHTDFTNREVLAFDFASNHVTVASWREVLVGVLRECAVRDRDGLFAFARIAGVSFLVDQPPATNERTFVEVVPGLQVLVSSSTKTKVGVLRNLLEHLGIDTEELVLTLRVDDRERGAFVDSDSQTGPYAKLTRFIGPMKELAGRVLLREETSELRREFAHEVTGFKRPLSELGVSARAFAEDDARVASASADQLCALITAILLEEEHVDPEALHRTIVDGSLVSWLQLLERTRA